jgi:hypothetical protein
MSPRESTARPCGAAAVRVVHADPAVARLGDRTMPLRGLALVPPQLGNVGASLRVEHEVGRALRVGPLAQILAVGTEDLDAIVLAVAHEHTAVGGDGDAVGDEELAGALARRAPRALELAGRRELVHAAVAVAVGDVEIALWADRQIRGPVERSAGPRDGAGVLAVVAGVRRRVHRPEGHEELAGRRELAHGVVAVVRAVDHRVRTDRDAVRAIGELALAPGAQKLALGVVDHDRMIAAADQEDAILAVDRHPCHVAVLVSARKLLPALDHAIFESFRHARPPRTANVPRG